MGRFSNIVKTIITDLEQKILALEPDSSLPVTVKNQPVLVDVNGQPIEVSIFNQPVLVDVNAQPIRVYAEDQYTRAFSLRVYAPIRSAPTIRLEAPLVVNDRVLKIISSFFYTVGNYYNLSLIQQTPLGPQLYFGSGLVVEERIYNGERGYTFVMDTLFPFTFQTSATVLEYSTDLNVLGSASSPVFLQVTNLFTTPVEITRLIFHITDTTVMDDAKFGGGPALENGLTFRKLISGSPEYINYWNIKTNGELGELAYDRRYDEKAPAGQYGMTARLTYAGKDKHGVVIRLDPGQRIEFVVQDNLSVLNTFKIMVQGHSINGF